MSVIDTKVDIYWEVCPIVSTQVTTARVQKLLEQFDGCVDPLYESFSSHWSIKVGLINLPGRTFLGKRHYFSGIAALTPLTPLTYKQNAVNAFIPTKNAVNSVNAVSFPVERR